MIPQYQDVSHAEVSEGLPSLQTALAPSLWLQVASCGIAEEAVFLVPDTPGFEA